MPLDNLSGFEAAPNHPMRRSDGASSTQIQVDRVGQQLRAYREASGLLQTGVAKKLGWSVSKVIRFEGGQNRPSATDARALLDTYEVYDEGPREQLLADVQANRSARLRSPYTNILSSTEEHYLAYEAIATSVCWFAPYIIPEPLRTTPYAQAMDAIYHPDWTSQKHDLSMGLHRQRAAYLLGEQGPPQQIIIDQAALYLVEGDPRSRNEGEQYAQLRAMLNGLLRISSERSADNHLNPNVEVRVAPLTHGTHPLSMLQYNILHIAEQPYIAVYTQDRPGRYRQFDPFSAESASKQQYFDMVWNSLDLEQTNSVLHAVLASLPS